MLHDVFYGSSEGGWLYPLINESVVWPVELGLMLAAVAIPLARFSRRLVARWPILVVMTWLVLGTGAQRLMRELAPFPDHEVVAGGNNPFHHESTVYSPERFLREFRELAPHLHFHVRANLAGKVLFYHALRGISEDPKILVWLLAAISNLGGLFAFAIVRRLFDDPAAGLAALILYLFLPSRLFFAPLLNSITPAFILLPLWLLVQFLSDHPIARRVVWLALLGMALYWSVLFEPLPLITGLTFLTLMSRAWSRGEMCRLHSLLVLAVVPFAFFATDVVVTQVYGYEIVSAFEFALEDARNFNLAQNRPYDVWVIQNLVDTLFSTGPLTSILLCGIAVLGIFRLAAAAYRTEGAQLREVATEPALCLALSVLASLAVVDQLGINRGETIRLWIFWGAFALLPVGGFCGRRPWLFSVLLTAVLIQSCIGLSSRAFVIP